MNNKNDAPFEPPKTNDEWSEPVSFDRFSLLPPFPVDALPPSIREEVLNVSELIQTPVDLPAVAALGILSTCVHDKYFVLGKEGWIEQLNLYVLIVLPPSERKSAVIKVMTQPITAFEEEYNRRLQQKCQENNEPLPPWKYIVMDSTTTEALEICMGANDGRASIISTEGGLFDILGGMYSNTPNIDLVLKGFSGDRHVVSRVTRNDICIPHTSLSMLQTVQPSVLKGLMRNKMLSSRGMTSRILFSCPKPKAGHRKFDVPPIPTEVQDNYNKMITYLIGLPYPETRKMIVLDKDATDLLRGLHYETEHLYLEDYADMTDWVAKYCGNTLRIAGLLCCASVDPDSKTQPEIITGDVMAKAIDIGHYFLAHARAAYDFMGSDPILNGCKKAVSVFENNSDSLPTPFAKRDLSRKCHFQGDDAEKILEQLEKHLYIRRVEIPNNKSNAKSSTRYFINPHCINRQ